MNVLEEMIEDLEYDGKLRQPVRYVNFCEKATQLISLLPNQTEEQYLNSLEAMTTSDILSFGDQLSKENASKLSNIKAGCNQALAMVNTAPTIEQGNTITR